MSEIEEKIKKAASEQLTIHKNDFMMEIGKAKAPTVIFAYAIDNIYGMPEIGLMEYDKEESQWSAKYYVSKKGKIYLAPFPEGVKGKLEERKILL